MRESAAYRSPPYNKHNAIRKPGNAVRLHVRLPISVAAFAMCTTGLSAQDAAAPTNSGKWSAIVNTLSGSGGMRGTAEFRVEPRNEKESRAKLSVRSVPINRQLAWDIVAGSCNDEGKPVAAPAAFRVLLTRNDGGGDAMANIPKLESGKRYYARVYGQGDNVTDRTAYGCANLSETP